VKKARLSEQSLGYNRPRPTHEDDEGQFILFLSYTIFCSYISLFIGVLSILDAATNDLALLINTLDLQATPITPDLTPLRPSPLPIEEVASEHYGSPKKRALIADSPLKNTL
jgi:hypothetical protein